MTELRQASTPRSRALVLLAALASGCAAGPATAPTAGPATGPASDVDRELAAITEVHGGAGPWVVAGYRMGEFALRRLGLPRGSFDLEVIHHSPREVQYSCVADGAATATGASLGKLNLSWVDATAEQTHTLYRRRSTGQRLDLRVTRAFAVRYLDVARDRLAQAGREVIGLPDDDIFTVIDDAHP